MSSQIALALTLLLIGYLLRRDLREEPRVSNAVWIPIFWLMIIGTRQVSQWLGIGGGPTSQAFEDGNSIDKLAFGALIAAGACVLAKRRVRVGEFVRSNPSIVLLILYEGLSVLWSDYPAVSFRRWVKVVGDPIMALVLCSDPFPARAITAAIKRCGYVLIPVSVLFCRYYPDLGRSFSQYGDSAYTGVTLDKNMLGYLLFAFATVELAFWNRPALSKIAHDHVRGTRNYVREINAVITLATVDRLLMRSSEELCQPSGVRTRTRLAG